MDEVLSIAPLAGEPGLIAYECPNCGYVTSVLIHPDGGRYLFVFDTGRFRAVSQAARQSVFISPAALKAWVMTPRMSTAEDGGAPGGTGGLTGLWSIAMAVGGRFRTGVLSFAAALWVACAKPQNFAMR